LSIFVENCQISTVFKFISDPELLGSGIFFPGPYPDPTISFGSDRIRIHNTVLNTVLFVNNAVRTVLT
jgi:hypothetical protein